MRRVARSKFDRLPRATAGLPPVLLVDMVTEDGAIPHGPWRLARSPALQRAFPIAYFDSLGIPRLLDDVL